MGQPPNFFVLPREVRDEIYRYLVKGTYPFQLCPITGSTKTRSYLIFWLSSTRPNIAIFLVSKAVYEEAISMLYSESIFTYHVGPPNCIRMPPSTQPWNRLTRIEIHFDRYRWSMFQPSEFEDGWNATLGMLTNTSSLRKSLLIKFCANADLKKISHHIFGKLKALVGFRTLTVGICPDYCSSVKASYMAQAIEAEMKPTMGVATVRNIDSEIYFEFRPLEHARKSRDLGEEHEDGDGNDGRNG